MPLIRKPLSSSRAQISNRATRYLPLPYLRAVFGFALAILAPVGWVVLQWFVGRDPFSRPYWDPLLYGYISIASFLTFTLLGYLIGRRELLITELALTDSLTALYNKRYFRNRLEQEFSRFRRHGTPMSLIQLDLDHFKVVNDTWGHQAGDEVLKTISALIMSKCRTNEIAARVGGEEISIIVSDSTEEEAFHLAERLRLSINACLSTWQGAAIQVTASLGVAQATREMENAWVLYERADQALYQAKQNGRNQVVCYQSNVLGKKS